MVENVVLSERSGGVCKSVTMVLHQDPPDTDDIGRVLIGPMRPISRYNRVTIGVYLVEY